MLVQFSPKKLSFSSVGLCYKMKALLFLAWTSGVDYRMCICFIICGQRLQWKRLLRAVMVNWNAKWIFKYSLVVLRSLCLASWDNEWPGPWQGQSHTTAVATRPIVYSNNIQSTVWGKMVRFWICLVVFAQLCGSSLSARANIPHYITHLFQLQYW